MLAKFQVLHRHVWLVATILNRDSEHFYHCRNFCWTVLHLVPSSNLIAFAQK